MKVTRAVCLDIKTVEKIGELAKKDNRSFSNVIEVAAKKYLKSLEDKDTVKK